MLRQTMSSGVPPPARRNHCQTGIPHAAHAVRHFRTRSAVPPVLLHRQPSYG
nr:MAG TPA: hypothetical protein [Caudoviricetes sp.]